jgi:hypothetical protein
MIVSPIRAPIVSPIYGGIRTAFDAIAGNATQQVLELLRAAGKKAFFPSTNPATGWWQDSNRATQAALEQPVGWIDDLSQGLVLGAEKVTNGGFSTDTAWTKGAGWTISGGQALFSGSGGVAISQNCGLVTGKAYRIVIDVAAIASGGLQFLCGFDVVSSTITTPGTHSFTLLCGSNAFLYIRSVGASVATIDNVTAKEFTGYHATQATSLNRPLYTKRLNLFQRTEEIDNAAWSKSVATAQGPLAFTFPTATARIQMALSQTTLSNYTISAWFGAADAGKVLRLVYYDGSAWQYGSDLTVPAGGGVVTRTITGAATVANAGMTGQSSGVSQAFTAFQGIDIRATAFAAMNLPAYQRVGNGTAGVADYDTAGFRDMLYFDGTSDALATSAIDLTGTDQIMALCNVLKVSDAVRGTVYEFGNLGTPLNGSLFINAPLNVATAHL